MITCQLFYGIFIVESFKEFGERYIHDDASLSLIGTIAAFSNAAAKFICPTLMDYIDYKSIYKYVLFFTLIQILTINQAVKNQYTFLFSVSFMFAVEGAISAMTPVLTLKIFGL